MLGYALRVLPAETRLTVNRERYFFYGMLYESFRRNLGWRFTAGVKLFLWMLFNEQILKVTYIVSNESQNKATINRNYM